MKRNTLIKILFFISLYFAEVHCSVIIESRKCLHFYDEGYLFRKTLYSYEEAIEYCRSVEGKPAMPTEKSWDDFLEYIRTQNADTYEGCWIGVELSRHENSTFHVVDSDGWELTDHQIGQIFNQSLESLGLSVGEKRCVTYFPRRTDNNTSPFQLQLCTTGPKARMACRCISDVEKYTTMSSAADTTTPVISSATQNNSLSNYSNTFFKPEGRIAEGGNNFVSNGDTDTVTDSTTPVAAILGLLAVCCLISTTYFLVKKKGWNLQQRLSRRISYSGRRRSTNGSTYYPAHEMSEMSRAENRPIHVYEEIIMRNSTAANLQRMTLVSASSSITIPQLPPPEPPAASALEDFPIRREERLSRSMDDGYLQPSFRRRDGIPGDVRSPPPVDSNMFTFPLAKMRKTELLPPQGQSELKYASVETVQTLLDGEQPTDEEYLVDDEEAELSEQNSHQFGSLVVEIPDEKTTLSSPGDKRNSVLNSYVPISGGFPQKQSQRLCQESDSSLVFLQASEYENERFLKAVAKVPPVKPKRRGLSTKIASVERKTDDSVVYSRIPSVSREAIYSKVTRKEGRHAESKVEDYLSGEYTPMHSDTLRRDNSTEMEEDNLFYSDFSDEETSIDQADDATENMAHEYQKIPNCGNIFISRPQMVSTTNAALANSTLSCYDIPALENEDNA